MKKLFKDLLTSDGKKLSLGRVSFWIAFSITMTIFIFSWSLPMEMVYLLGLLLGYGTLSKVPRFKSGFNSIKDQYRSRD